MTIACGDAAMTVGSASSAGGAVHGTVIDADGEPAGNVAIAIGDVVTKSDVDGKFTLPVAAARYDAALTVGHTQRAYVFKSLTSRAPTLRLFDVALSLRSHSARVRVVLPEALPEGAKLVVTASFADDAARISEVVPEQAADGVVVAVRWLGPPSATLDLFAIAYQPDEVTLAPTRYLGVATARGTRVEHLQPITVPLRYEESGEDGTVRARVATPAGHALEWTSLFVELGPGAQRTKLADRLGGDASVTFRVPDLRGAKFHVEANAYDGGNDLATFASEALVASGPEAVLDLARAPQLRAPRHDATSVSNATEFAWERAGGGAGVTWVYFGPEDQTRTDEPRIWIATPDSATTIPDLRALGIGLPKHARGIWYVVAARGAKTMADAAAQGLFKDGAGAGGNTGALKYTTE